MISDQSAVRKSSGSASTGSSVCNTAALAAHSGRTLLSGSRNRGKSRNLTIGESLPPAKLDAQGTVTSVVLMFLLYE